GSASDGVPGRVPGRAGPVRPAIRGATLRHALHAEWTKLRTLRSSAWLLLGLAVLMAGVGAAVTGSVDTSACPSPAGCQEDTPRLSLSGVQIAQVAAVVLGVLTIGGEFSTGTISATLAAVPRRALVLLAKATVITGTVAVAASAGVLGSLAAGRLLLPGQGFTAANGYPPLSLADGPTLRAASGTVLYLVLVALLSFGAGTALRDTAGAITGVLALLWLAPVITRVVGDEHWRDRLEKIAPMPAGLSIQYTKALDRLAIGPWAGLGVLAAYAAAALLLGGALFVTRDP
ncbi:hypothetical protein, partial [Actinomadura fibrosa]